MTNQKDELAALKKEVEALKSALSGKEDKPPPKKEFVPQPYQRYDPTEGMTMPPSALREMAGHPCNQVMRGVIQDRHAPTSPGMVPQVSSGGGDAAPVNKTGWRDATPIGPPPGIDLIDRAVNAALPHGPEWGKEKSGA
jgi:hypothetical protein